MQLSDYLGAINEYSDWLEHDKDMTTEDLLKAGRLWNTVCHYTALQSTPVGKRFFELGRDRLLPRIVSALGMEVSRGMSWYSKSHDFRIGGPPAERYRYSIGELEAKDIP